MRLYTPEEMAVLAPFEPHFNTALHMGFKRPSPAADNNTVADILEAASGQKFARNWSCSHCLYKVWSEAAKIYYKTKEETEKAVVADDEKAAVASVKAEASKTSEEKKKKISEGMKAWWKRRREQNAEGKKA